MFLFVDLSAEAEGLPCEAIVRDHLGGAVYRTIVSRTENRLCLRLESGRFSISLRPLRRGFYADRRYFTLGDRKCAYLNLSFRFRQETAEQTFYLYDGNYHFPINAATLYFAEER